MSNELGKRIDSMIGRFEREDVNMHGFILSVNGKRKAEAYYAPFKKHAPHRMYSVSKTFTGIAVGMLISDGLLNLDDRICTWFSDWLPENPDGRLTRLTIRDMLRMATCYRFTQYREGTDENWAQRFFTGAPTHEPGTVFYYDTGCSQALAALVRRISGREVIDFLEERLFAPLGATDEKNWLRDPSGCCQGGTGLCMSLEDMHTVSECILNGGMGIIPAWYCRAMGEKQIDTPLQTNEEEKYGYGWQCWRTRAGWAMYGLGGQLSVVCPEKRVIWSTIADTRLDPVGVQRIYDAFFEEVYPYIGKEDMDQRSYALTVRGLPNDKGAFLEPGVYQFDEGNPLRLKTMEVQSDRLVYENNRGSVILPFAPGQTISAPYPGWPEVPALVSAGFVRENVLRIRCHAIGNAPCGFDMLLVKKDGTLTVQCRKSFDPVTEGYDGVATGSAITCP